jgi:DNA-binding NtrC family response regulator
LDRPGSGGKQSMSRFRIAVVDDEAIVVREIKRSLAKQGYAVETFLDGESALERLARKDFDLLISDLRLPGISGLDLLKAVREHNPQCETILITAHGTVDSAIEAIRSGAFHYVTKPIRMADLRLLVKRALDKVTLVREKEALKEELFSQSRPVEIIGNSKAMHEVFQLIDKVAPLDCNVLIQGESGTGKEMVARALHRRSSRSRRPFVSFNCGGFTEDLIANELFGHEKGAFTGATEQKPGIFELADHGTLFLDEIGDMPAELQAKVLRALQEQEVWRVGGKAPVKIDVRIIAATHKDIKTQRRQLNFRDDLYYRLANVEITASSLRERPEDIAPLCEMILSTFSREHRDEKKSLCLSAKALRLLEAYDWPGNIRELRNTMIQIILKCDGATIEPRHLKGLIDVYAVPPKSDEGPLPSLVEVERVHIIKALKSTNWNKSAAAKVLDIDRNRLNRRLKSLGIDSPDNK